LLAQFSDDWRGAFFARFLNVKLSVAKQNFKRPKLWFRSFDHVARLVRNGRHASEQDVDLLRKVGLYQESLAPAYGIQPTSLNINFVKDWLLAKNISLSKKIIVIHSSSRWKFKTMRAETWVDLINKLYAHGEYQILLSGGPADISFNQEIISNCNFLPVLACDFTLGQTAALYKYADLLISIDSMSIHLASALSKPIVAIFGPTDVKVWGPHAVKFKALTSLHSCVPCGIDGCGGGKVSYCLESIPSDQIFESVIEVLSDCEL
jgi:heptosyltransferase-3